MDWDTHVLALITCWTAKLFLKSKDAYMFTTGVPVSMLCYHNQRLSYMLQGITLKWQVVHQRTSKEIKEFVKKKHL